MGESHQELLLSLKTVVEGLLSSQVLNVWNVYGGLSRLHQVLERILKHGCSVFKQNGEEDCWIFIEGLNWIQPSLATFPTPVNIASPPPHQHTDRAMIWLHNSLETHTLSEKLLWLLSDEGHLRTCYHPLAYLRQSQYAEATIICLRAVEQYQPGLLTEYLSRRLLRVASDKSHRRCSSYPEVSLQGYLSGCWLPGGTMTTELSMISAPSAERQKSAVVIPSPSSTPVISSIRSSPPVSAESSLISSRSEVKPDERNKRRSFLEAGGTGVQPMSTGFFPQPRRGQSLIGFLSSAQFARTSAQLDRENAHFSISEGVISVIEQVLQLLTIFEESDEEIQELKQRIRLRRRQKQQERRHHAITSAFFPASSASSTQPFSDTSMSLSMASLYSEADLSRPQSNGDCLVSSAESVAISLLRKFSDKRLPRASDIEWLVSEKEAPQQLLPMPTSWAVSSDDAELELTTPLRGTSQWAPPRPQIIFTTHPPPKRKELMQKQQLRCAGCGVKVLPEYANRFRYCDYLGRYFCTGCHSSKQAIIPGRILSKWDYSRYSVSDFSFNLLEQIWTDPLFSVEAINRELYKRIKALEKCRNMRRQLYYIKDFLVTCRFAQE
ncbi:hypothetical protein AAG570_002034 [Ranatra chinensis]|uniref:RUN domain-containing protein n=1 Tax=Ranatra chinensis TaxID=642074 RepID=A0ABD0YC60_9HEMI